MLISNKDISQIIYLQIWVYSGSEQRDYWLFPGIFGDLFPRSLKKFRSVAENVSAAPSFEKAVLEFLEPGEIKGPIVFHKGWSLGKCLKCVCPFWNWIFFNTYWQMDYCSFCRKACLWRFFEKIYIGLIPSPLWKWTFYPEDTRYH